LIRNMNLKEINKKLIEKRKFNDNFYYKYFINK